MLAEVNELIVEVEPDGPRGFCVNDVWLSEYEFGQLFTMLSTDQTPAGQEAGE